MDIIKISESAVAKVLDMLAEESDENLKLRIFVTGGGCSGFQYGFTFDQDQAEDDSILEYGLLKVLVDPMSYQYLQGAQVDYIEDLTGCRFEIKNPNATTTCGCGSSFSV